LIIFPAIDLYGGRVVRLEEGDFTKKTFYGNPLDTAKSFRDAGCGYIHVVDLEGAEAGEPRHLDELGRIAGLGLFVQYGGGLRSRQGIAAAIDSGARRVMVGSLLFAEPNAAASIADMFGNTVMPAIDVRKGRVVHSGWLRKTSLAPSEVIKSMRDAGFTAFLVTNTERDGLMRGVDADFYKPLLGEGYDIVAAGGITSAKDIAALAKIGVGGAVIGKSLYEGGITLAQALDAARNAAD